MCHNYHPFQFYTTLITSIQCILTFLLKNNWTSNNYWLEVSPLIKGSLCFSHVRLVCPDLLHIVHCGLPLRLSWATTGSVLVHNFFKQFSRFDILFVFLEPDVLNFLTSLLHFFIPPSDREFKPLEPFLSINSQLWARSLCSVGVIDTHGSELRRRTYSSVHTDLYCSTSIFSLEPNAVRMLCNRNPYWSAISRSSSLLIVLMISSLFFVLWRSFF